MPEIGTSGLTSGDGKRDGLYAPHPRLSSTLPGDLAFERACEHPTEPAGAVGWELVDGWASRRKEAGA